MKPDAPKKRFCHLKTDKNHWIGSHKVGEMVERVGKNHLHPEQTGYGIVLAETNIYGVSCDPMIDLANHEEIKAMFDHLKIHWIDSRKEENLHKSMVRKVPDVSKVVIVKRSNGKPIRTKA